MDFLTSFANSRLDARMANGRYAKAIQDASEIELDVDYILKKDVMPTNTAEELDESELIDMSSPTGSNWAAASQRIYETFRGDRDLKGRNMARGAREPQTPEEYAQWGIEFIGQMNHNFSSMAVNTVKLNGQDDMTNLAMHHLFQDYERLPGMSWNGTKRFFKGIATDPTTYIGLGTLGFGTLGVAGAKQMSKQGFSRLLRGSLNPKMLAAYEGAGYTGAFDLMRQNVDVQAKIQDELDFGQAGFSTALGGVAGRALAEGVDQVVKNAPAIAGAVREGIDQLGQAADARTLQRAQETSVQLNTGVDPMQAIDAALSGAGRVVRDQNDRAVDAAKNVDEARAALEASPNDPVLKQQYLDLRRARDAELSQMSPTEQLKLDVSYRMQHQPRGPQDGGGRLDDITAGGELFPDDVYSANGLRFYGNPNDSFDRQSHAAILAARGNPEAEITIYRGVPTDVNQINAGDWVTLSPDYAAMHAASGYGPNGDQAGKVISQRVKVKDVFSDGNDLNEFGYFPADLAELGVKKIVPPTETEPGIIAFHGSGADFDEFRLEMIGTGEGAQAYGYGLYFTDSEDIAKFYRDSIGRGRSSIVYDGSSVKNAREVDGLTDREMVLDNIATEMAFFDQKPANVIEKKIKSLKARIDDPVEISPYADDAEAQELADLIRQSAQRDLEIYESLDPDKFTRGKMYKVALSPKPDELLDYDLPFAEQSKDIQEKLLQAGYEVDPRTSGSGGMILEAIMSNVGREGAHLELGGKRSDARQVASQRLANAGIPGIKYFSGNSRTTAGGKLIDVSQGDDGFRAKVAVENRSIGGKGRVITTSPPYKTEQEALDWAEEATKRAERNYVIFDDKAVKILEKYGIAGPVAVTTVGVKSSQDNDDTVANASEL